MKRVTPLVRVDQVALKV